MPVTNSEDPRLAGRVAFTYPNFVSYTFARFFIVLALEMQSVAVGWQVYEITKSALDSHGHPSQQCALATLVSRSAIGTSTPAETGVITTGRNDVFPRWPRAPKRTR